MTMLLIFSWPTLYFMPFHCAKKRSAAAYFYFFCSVQSPRSNCTFFPDATVNYLAHSTSVCPLNLPRHSTCFDWHCLALFDSDFIAFRMALWLVSLSLDFFCIFVITLVHLSKIHHCHMASVLSLCLLPILLLFMLPKTICFYTTPMTTFKFF